MIKAFFSHTITAICMLLFMLKTAEAQPVTGIWQGRINFKVSGISKYQQMEMKLVRTGDSLAGIAYYHNGRNSYLSVPVAGYFDPYDGTVKWWHTGTQGVDENGRNLSAGISADLDFVADFNCPGDGIMKLDGEAGTGPESGIPKNFPLHLTKTDKPLFNDEWDDRIDDPSWASHIPKKDPDDITDQPDRNEKLKLSPPASPVTPGIPEKGGAEATPALEEKSIPKKSAYQPGSAIPVEDLFEKRKRVLVAEIPVSGDTLELDFYDHAEIDGDSISIFLNNKLVKEHILLKADAYRLRIPVADLGDMTELTMVAENLGSIPPNTSLMIAYVGGIRYETRLESTETTSAMVRFTRPKDTRGKRTDQ
jgi:hypothetical protein